ncbi:pantothenate kinase [Anaplasma centrale str. Israel]|uniref:Type III pantothenate kinase n=1 Tax=Anaplasma centrale (strain Israel) TaxID=574556 RepID=D1ASQ2_ANACI|nr:type III pantothenate kinase [Anaplasma centrale]ACZ49505.1 pantothenate kinase [Anaplasma centrale str. Israel]
MMVAVDVGNTSTKIALYENGTVVDQWRISTCKNRTAAEYFACLSVLASHGSVDLLAGVRGAAISSVVPVVNGHIEELFECFFGISPVFVTNSHADLFGLRILLTQPTIGADRVADLVAAKILWPARDLLVIDMGTVTVFNLLDKDGALYGQVMAPGVSCLIHSMRECTALLPQTLVREPEKIVCGSTAPSLEAGLYWGYRTMVEGITKQIIREGGARIPYVVATGGGVNLFGNCNYIDHIDRLLTIKGIVQIYEKARD